MFLSGSFSVRQYGTSQAAIPLRDLLAFPVRLSLVSPGMWACSVRLAEDIDIR